MALGRTAPRSGNRFVADTLHKSSLSLLGSWQWQSSGDTAAEAGTRHHGRRGRRILVCLKGNRRPCRMPWNDFVRYFTDISMCGLFNTSIFSLSKRFHEEHFYGEWTTNGAKSGAPNDFAGGCLNFAATFCSNPQVGAAFRVRYFCAIQYAFDITSTDNEVMFALTQREECEGSKKREPWVTIGMHIMRVENNRRFRVHQVSCRLCSIRCFFLVFDATDSGLLAEDRSRGDLRLRQCPLCFPPRSKPSRWPIRRAADDLRAEGAGQVPAEGLLETRLSTASFDASRPTLAPLFVQQDGHRHEDSSEASRD